MAHFITNIPPFVMAALDELHIRDLGERLYDHVIQDQKTNTNGVPYGNGAKFWADSYAREFNPFDHGCDWHDHAQQYLGYVAKWALGEAYEAEFAEYKRRHGIAVV